MTSLPDENKTITISIPEEDRIVVEKILRGDRLSATFLLDKKCRKIFEYINRTRFKDLELDVDELVNDFYIFLHENNWEKLRSFRFESKLQTWINVVAARFLTKKYASELKECTLRMTPIDGLPSFTDNDHDSRLIRTELMDAINSLQDKRGKQVLLLTLQGFDSDEIAEHLGTSTTNIYVMRSRAIEKLKTLLNG